jgi:hypothetical protein
MGVDKAGSRLTLECKDSAGKRFRYSVDLTSKSTFAPHPLELANQRGIDRPALKGDPLAYTQFQLIQAGYGLRPDPQKNSAAYARWLAASAISGRILTAGHPPAVHAHTVSTQGGGFWVGSELTGAPNYIWTDANFNVPRGIPGGGGTNATAMSIWNGLGTGSSALIQGGVDLSTTPCCASYSTFREYCCGNPNERNENFTAEGFFTPNPGDQIYSQEWYCDASGNANIRGGFGCSFLVDMTSGAIVNCSSASGSPCASVKADPICSANPPPLRCTLGDTAEFIIENASPQQKPPSNAFPDFAPTVNMSGGAITQTGSLLAVGTDPNVLLLIDSINIPPRIFPSVDLIDTTSWKWVPEWWTPQQVGIGGGTSVGPSLAVFNNRLYAAWKGTGGDQEMYWSSFLPRSVSG